MSEHAAVDDYITARKVGDEQTSQRIVAEVTRRFNTRTTDGSEAAALYRATLEVPLAHPAKN